MMQRSLLTALTVVVLFMPCLVLTGCSEQPPAGKGPLVIKAPPGWTLEFENTEDIDFYTLTSNSEQVGVLMLSQWPPPGRPEQIPALVRSIADEFVKSAAKSDEYSLVSDEFEVRRFTGENARGSYVTLDIAAAENKNVQVIFMMSINAQIWNGQFTGPPEKWQQALDLITKIKPTS